MGARRPGERHWYGLAPGEAREAWEADGQLVLAGAPLIAMTEVPLPGEHMRRDVLAAALAARLAGAAADAIAEGIRRFRGVRHRLETIADRDGGRWVKDWRGTMPVGAGAGLEAFGTSPV